MLITKALKSNARLVLALTATVIASAPIYSHADESSRTIKFSKPITAAEAHHVYTQIERAAYYACGTSSMDMEVMMNAPGPCVHLAISRAILNTKNPKLAQVYIEKNGNDEARKFGISSDVMTAKN
jgi:hypothetical protein